MAGAYTTDDATAWLNGSGANAALGGTLGAGDLNGDGFGDLLIGSPDPQPTSEGPGAALLIYGGG